MYNILVVGMTENPGGIESFLINIFRNIDKERFHMDFLCDFMGKCAYEDEIIESGSAVYHICRRGKNPLRFRKELSQVLSDNQGKYNAMWVNVCNLANVDFLVQAKRFGIPRRIIHSHSSQNMDSSKLRAMQHTHNKKRIGDYATDFWSCAADASKFFYNEKVLPKSVIIHNAIDTSAKQFSPEKRAQIRQSLGISEECTCIGHVGRLHYPKNQEFALDVFHEYRGMDATAKMVFVGCGENKEMLLEKVKELQLDGAVVFAGMQGDVQGWLSAFDAFLFPSRFEGLSIAALEAQANGLPVLAADTVARESRVNLNFLFKNLGDSPTDWANTLYELVHQTGRIDSYDEIRQNFKDKGYENAAEIARIERLLLN